MEQMASNSALVIVLRALYDRLLRREQALLDLSLNNTSLSLAPSLHFFLNQLARMQDYCLYMEASYATHGNGDGHPVGINKLEEDVQRFEHSMDEFLFPWS